MGNMITVYNQIVGKDDSDCTKFKEILDKHFEKYKYFYKLLTDIGDGTVKRYYCTRTTPKSIMIRMVTDDKTLLDRIISYTNNGDNTFNTNITSSKSYINIEISNKVK